MIGTWAVKSCEAWPDDLQKEVQTCLLRAWQSCPSAKLREQRIEVGTGWTRFVIFDYICIYLPLSGSFRAIGTEMLRSHSARSVHCMCVEWCFAQDMWIRPNTDDSTKRKFKERIAGLKLFSRPHTDIDKKTHWMMKLPLLFHPSPSRTLSTNSWWCWKCATWPLLVVSYGILMGISKCSMCSSVIFWHQNPSASPVTSWRSVHDWIDSPRGCTQHI